MSNINNAAETTSVVAMLQFELARITPNGVASYEADGLRGSIYVTKSMWADKAPDSISLPAALFATPKVSASKKVTDPAVAAAKAKELQEKAAKAQARADKLKAQAASLVPTVVVENAFAGLEVPEAVEELVGA